LRNIRNVFDISVDDAKELLEKFAKSEHDINGHIGEEGFVKMFPQAKDDRVVRKLFHLLDSDGHGWVDFREYVLGVSLLNGKDKEGMDSALKLAFRCFDTENKGSLGFEALTKVLRMGFPNLKIEQAKIMFDEADADLDGKVSIDDFLHFCHNHESVLPKFRDKIFGVDSLHAAETKGTVPNTAVAA
jgi:Ca2+-binding EF-hand superfamily protein